VLTESAVDVPGQRAMSAQALTELPAGTATNKTEDEIREKRTAQNEPISIAGVSTDQPGRNPRQEATNAEGEKRD